MGFSVEPITKKSWQVRYAVGHEKFGDDFTGALRISEIDNETLEICAMVTMPSKSDLIGMREYFSRLGYKKVIRRRMKDGIFEQEEREI